jgi:hypothetical protein
MQKMLLLIALSSAQPGAAQSASRFPDGLRVNLSDDSTRYLKATLLMQTWVRYNANNPGSTVFGYTQGQSFDVGMRRVRFQLFGIVAPRVFVYTQFGLNSFNYLSARKSGAFFHDLVTEYEVLHKHLSVGAGLNGWTGPARFSTPAVGSIMMADAPVFQQATNDAIDQFVRKTGVYAKGRLGPFDYRVAVSKPFTMQTATASNDTTLGSTASFSPRPPRLQYQGYFQWQFLDKESNVLPYNTGSYFGKRRVFTLGSGFVYQDQAVRYLANVPATTGDTMYRTLLLWAIDAFFDSYLDKNKRNALSVYAAFCSYDFGQKYLRYNGVMNTATGSSQAALYGKGNYGSAFPMIGTGTSGYLQAGYKFRDGLLGKPGTLMPYGGVQLSSFRALSDPMLVAEVGLNWLPGGANKLSLNYQSRPVFANQPDGTVREIRSARRGMLYLQYQIAL